MGMTRQWIHRLRVVTTALSVVVALPACGDDPPTSPASARETPAPAAAALTPEPATAEPVPAMPVPLPDPVRVGRLPDSGVAVGMGPRVLFLDLEGRVIQEVEGFELTGNRGAPGVWLKRGKDHFRLHAGYGVLIPVAPGRAKDRAYDEGDPPALRPPPTAWTKQVGVSGHWRYAYRSGTGTVLAQWSDECAAPTAFWKEPGRRPEVITGGHDSRDAPESMALGWSPDGRAIVQLGAGACGTSGDPPGIYSFAAPGEGTLLLETPSFVQADMWR